MNDSFSISPEEISQTEGKIFSQIQSIIEDSNKLLLTSIIRQIEIERNVRILIHFDNNLKEYQSLLLGKLKRGNMIFSILLPTLLKESEDKKRRHFLRYLLGHELGHILFHVDRKNFKSYKESDIHNLEANLFALQVLEKRGEPKERFKPPEEFEAMARKELFNGKDVEKLFKSFCEE